MFHDFIFEPFSGQKLMATVFDSDMVHKFLSNGRKRIDLFLNITFILRLCFVKIFKEFGSEAWAESLTQKELKK